MSTADKMTEDLLTTTDGMAWAGEFMRLFGSRREVIDFGLMASWFANAIEVGRRAGEQGVRAHDPR